MANEQAELIMSDAENPEEPREERRNPALEFVRLTYEKRTIEEQLRRVKGQLNNLEPEVIDQMTDMGLQNIKTVDGATVYLQMDVFASLVSDDDGTKDEAHEALREHELGYLVKEGVNAQSLRAYVNERKSSDEEIPAGLLPYIKVTETPRARVRSGD